MVNQTDLLLIKKLREETQAPVLAIKKILTETKGDLEKARLKLKELVRQKAAEKKDQITTAGLVEAYVHTNQKVAALVVLTCQTDFVARTTDFKTLAHEIALQVASMKPKNVVDLLEQSYIRDPKKTIKTLIEEYIGKLGENIKVKEIVCLQV